MKERTNYNSVDLRIIIFFSISLVLMIAISFIDFSLFSNQLANEMTLNSVSRFLGGIVFVVILYMIGYKRLFKFNGPILKSLLIILPGLIIAVNNFPIIAYFDGRAGITEPFYTIYIFIIECVSTGFFEEIVFRGIVLLLLLQKLPNSKKGMYLAIFISSAIFGLTHLLNLFIGAGTSDTFIQIAYSFLMGLMWAVVYLKTKNIWMSILLHSTYNFFGLVLFRLGYVNGRFDNVTLVVTILLAIVVAIYMFYISLKIEPNNLKDFYSIDS